MNGGLLAHELSGLSADLKAYGHDYFFEGDKSLEQAFNLTTDAEQYYYGLLPFHQEGSLAVLNGHAGTISKLDAERHRAMFEPIADQKNNGFYQQYTQVRDQYYQLSEKEAAEQIAYTGLREQLQKSYSTFVQQYGELNRPLNRKLILADGKDGFKILSSMERKDGTNFLPSDILAGPVFSSQEAFKTDDPVSALARCLNEKGRVDLSFIGTATGLNADEAIISLQSHICLNPNNYGWETIDQYLSGNVVEKLTIAQQQAQLHPDDQQLQRSLQEITRVQPAKIPFDWLDFNLGERWFPLDYYNRFATALFEQDTSITYLHAGDKFKVSTKGKSLKVSQEYAVSAKGNRTTYGYTLLEHALENTTPFFTYEISVGAGQTKRVPDNEAIQLAHQKIENIRTAFVNWLQELPDNDKKDIEKLYNDTFNCYVLREYNGDHLTFPGLDKKALGIDDLYSSQKNAAWRIMQNRGALIDHEVGLGKTLTMIVAAQEMKRLGIVHKPMILALKANVRQIAETYRKAYPAARILAPEEDDFVPAKRLRLFYEIKNNNWDCIILTHDQFGKIPQSPEMQQAIFRVELENTERDLDTLKSEGGDISRRMLKGLEVRKKNLQVKLKSLKYDIEHKQDKGINFKEMGIDHLFVDESHKFKNLTFTTRHDRVAGLGNMEGSQKALNMLFAVRTLQEQFNSDLCVTFLSGTPISNSLTEMYLIFKYLRPKELERQSIENFDGWAAVFAKKTTDFEFSITNEIVAKERFRYFIKVPELALFYNEITDYKTAKHIGLDKPEMDERLVSIPLTPDQQDFTLKLIEFARNGDARLIGRPKLTPEEDKGRMLIATNYAKKMAADMRLVDSYTYEDHPGNKVSICARQVAEEYHASSAYKGTQIIFSDIGTPKPGVFNIYDAIKEKLVRDLGIPAQEITFIHDWTDKQKPALFRKMNRGEVRILLGSTEKAGTGLNVQERIIALHDFDIPWTPKDLDQRGGRGARQGNKAAKKYRDNKVKRFIYGNEKSLDNYKLNLLKNKQLFISQMKNCELSKRTIDEGTMDEKSGMNLSEYIAVLSGDTSLLEKSKLEKKIAVMESLKSAHFRELSRARYAMENQQSEKEKILQMTGRVGSDEQVYKNNLKLAKDGTKINAISLDGLPSVKPDEIGRYLIRLTKTWKPKEGLTGTEKIGSLYGFDLMIRRQSDWVEDKGRQVRREYNTLYATRPETGIHYNYTSGIPNPDNPKLAARYFLNAIDKVEGMLDKYKKELAELDENIPKLETLLSKPFEKDREIQQLKSELGNLERQIAVTIQEKQLKQNQAQKDAADEQAPQKEATVIPLKPDEPMEKEQLLARANGAPVRPDESTTTKRIRQKQGLRI
jgi:N12 class adenine-specific DNA methylase